MTESPLPAVFESGLVAEAALAVVLEPTDCILHAGCLGNIQARVTFHGESAHSARPWTGVNAIHELVPGLQSSSALEPLDVELDGLSYREVVSAVRVDGGIAANVVPAAASVELNFRYAPAARRRGRTRLARSCRTARSRSSATPRPRRPRSTNPLVAAAARARAATWRQAGLDAGRPVRGAGDRRDQLRARALTRYAHRRDEQVPIENLDRRVRDAATFLA